MYQPRSSRSKKEKNFSSRGKIEKYNNDGTETIIVMGRPFRVLMKIGDSSKSLKSRSSRNANDGRSQVFLVENTENMREFPHRLVLRRSFYKLNEVLYAHREPEISARISDKGIARVFHCEVTRSEGTLGVTVAMEFFPSNLHRRLKQETRMTESEIAHVMFALVSAVGYLHSQKPPIAHRDIRPENILINTNVAGAGAYRLCNFSRASTEAYQCENREEIAAALDDLERLSQTPFRAPEMFDPGSGKRIDERVDLWSIGVLLYFMMFNRLPFLDSNLGSTGRLNLRIPMDSGHTGSLCVLLEHLLQPDPERRWDIFALTNYMRFDEDISRHLGTFFFTATEWPDGWEQQDVRVINRPHPPKAPPIRIDDGRTKSREGWKKTHSNDDNEYGNGAEGERTGAPAARHAQRRSGQQRSAPHGAGLDEAAEIAAALGLSVNSSDPEMIAYREQLIREQEEAWERAKEAASASKKKKDVESSGPPREKERAKTPPRKKGTEAQPEFAATIVARLKPESETKPMPTKDIFDDLFDSTPVPTAPTESVILHSQANFPQGQQPQQQQQQQQNRVENEGFMLRQELFGGMQPQPQPQSQPQFDLGGWSTGAPMEYGGAYQESMPMASYQQQQLQPQQLQQLQPQQLQQLQPMQPMQPQQLQPMQPQQLQPMQQQQLQPMQQQQLQPMQQQQLQPMQQQQLQPMQQQQQQASMDFMQGNFPQAAPKREAPEVKPQHKDPFESLFY